MKPTGESLEAAIRQKRLAAGEAPRPPKRARGEGRTEPTQARVVPAEMELVTPPVDPAPAEAGTSASGEIAREKEKIPETTVAVVTVLDEVEVTAAAEVPEAGRAPEAADPPAAAGLVEKEIASRPGKKKAEEEPAAKAAPPSRPRGEAFRPARKSAPRITSPQIAEGGRDPNERRVPRAAPRLSISRDAVRATELVTRMVTEESEAEMRQLSCSDILDSVMVSVVQMCHGALALRGALLRSGEALASTTSRADKYKKECAVMSQNLSKVQQEGRAREENLSNRTREAESRASAAESELRAAASREEDLIRRLRHAEDQAEAARREALANAAKAAAAEAAATDAGHEKAGAVAYANEANARAEEAEARAGEAEARATEAEARAEKAEARAEKAEAKAREADVRADRAVAEYKSSSDFENEVIEASLHSYLEGFTVCKAKVAAHLKIADAVLEEVQAGDLGEAPAEEEEAGTEGERTEKGLDENRDGAEDRDAAENRDASEKQSATDPEKL